jgi:hypothetical protein
MYCYYCEEHHPGGTNFGTNTAHGICKNCGVAVCAEHSRKASTPGAPLLCLECAKVLKVTNSVAQPLEKVPDIH